MLDTKYGVSIGLNYTGYGIALLLEHILGIAVNRGGVKLEMARPLEHIILAVIW